VQEVLKLVLRLRSNARWIVVVMLAALDDIIEAPHNMALAAAATFFPGSIPTSRE
jgi:hypothetical protein